MAAALALAACGGARSPAPPISNNGGGGEGGAPLAATPGFRHGALWSCQINGYSPQPCKLSRAADGWHLDKLLGSQRFSGRLEPQGMGLVFDGEFFCPWGECTTAMNVDFSPDGPDGRAGYTATFQDDDLRLRYDLGLESEYGAAGYGGLTGRETE